MTSVRDEVSKELEKLREAGEIGSALDSEVILYCDEQQSSLLKQLEDELRFVLITSSATVIPLSESPDDAVATEINGIKIKVTVSSHDKCVRCWHHREEFGRHSKHPKLCGRFVENSNGECKTRRYA